MKKILAIVLVLVMVFALCACGAKTEEPKVEEAKVEEAKEEAAEAKEAIEEAAADAEEVVEEVEALVIEKMDHAAFSAAKVDDPVCVESFISAKQAYSAEYGNTTLYLQDDEGAYFVYRLACSQDEYDAMEVGKKIKVTGYKAEWSGEVEISDATFEMVETDETFKPVALDVTGLLGKDELSAHMNEFVTVKGAKVAASKNGEEDAAFLYNWDGSGEDGNDLYFNIDANGVTLSFTVETDLTPAGTDVYEAVKGLKIGDTIDLEGYLYWYEGPQMHVTGVKAA